jgi:hypothetical protein
MEINRTMVGMTALKDSPYLPSVVITFNPFFAVQTSPKPLPQSIQ